MTNETDDTDESDLTFVRKLLAEGQEELIKQLTGPESRAADLSVQAHYRTWFIRWHTEGGYRFLLSINRIGKDPFTPWNAWSVHMGYPHETLEEARKQGLRIWNELPLWKRGLWSIGFNVDAITERSYTGE